jgi:lysophospholipase L1-like esterase
LQRNLFIIPILILLAINCSCVKETVTVRPAVNIPIPPVTQPPSNIEKTYLALGDSYTIGHGVPPDERYPMQTKNWLKAHGITGIKDPQIIATSGWTTANLQAAIESQNPSDPFDAVSILIGVNDQYRGAEYCRIQNTVYTISAELYFICQ